MEEDKFVAINVNMFQGPQSRGCFSFTMRENR